MTTRFLRRNRWGVLGCHLGGFDRKVSGLEGWWAASYVVLWLLVMMLIVTVVALARQIGTLHLRLGPRGALELDGEGPALGDMLPPVETRDLDGSDITLGGPQGAQLLLFVTPGCGVCEQVLPSLHAVASIGDHAPFVITDVDAEETRIVYGGKRINAPLIPDRDAAASYGVPGTPYVIITGDDGLVRAKGTVNNLEQMEGLVDSARRRNTEEVRHA